jgi:hypothetical protein
MQALDVLCVVIQRVQHDGGEELLCYLLVVAALTSPYFSIRQHSSAYVSIRQHSSAYVSICQHMSAYVSIRQRRTEERSAFGISASSLPHPSDYVSVRQHTSENVRIREDTSGGWSSFGISSSSLLTVMSLPLTSRLRPHALVA